MLSKDVDVVGGMVREKSEDAMSYKVKDAMLYKVRVGNSGGWDFPSFSEALSYAKSMATQNKEVVKIYPLHSGDNKIIIINEKGQVIGNQIIPNPKENYRQWFFGDSFGMNTEEQQKDMECF